MGKPRAPAAPDPRETAAAQTGTNISTATANSYLNNFNQVTPDGTLTFTDNGSQQITDPSTGETYDIPIRTATTTLSPQQQAIKDQSDAASLNLATIGNNQSGFLQDYLSEPVTLNNEETESRLYELGRTRLDPRFKEGRESLETRLANQGIGLGTEAYDRAISNYGEQENDAYNQLLLSGRGQAIQEQLTERNQPLNEISALLSGSQVSQPQFVGTNSANIATTDYAGLVNQDYQNRLGIYQQDLNSFNSTVGAAAQLGTTLLSDERAKKDKEKIGSVDGMGLYEYRYKGAPSGSPKEMGLMAQEVKKKRPEAVSKRPDGLYQVDYAKALKGKPVPKSKNAR